MTAHLVNACREIDDQLLECLMTWSNAAEQGCDRAQLAPIHKHYVQHSTRLIEARSAIESALRVLEGTSGLAGSYEPEPSSTVPDAKTRDRSAPICLSVACVCADRSGAGRAAEGSSSRPDRPHRPQECCRGQIRDWNRDILACRLGAHADGQHPDFIECVPVPVPVAGAGRSGADEGNGYETCFVAAPAGETEEAGETQLYPADEPAGLEGNLQYPDEPFVKEPENGTQSKSSRSRKRG